MLTNQNNNNKYKYLFSALIFLVIASQFFSSVYAFHLNGELLTIIVKGIFGTISSATPVPISVDALNISSAIFDRFFEGLNKWLWSYNNTHNDHIGMYDKLGSALQPIFAAILQLLALFIFTTLLLGKFADKFYNLIKFFVFIVIASLFLGQGDLFKEWIFEPLLDLLVGLMMILLGNADNILNTTTIGQAIFGGVEQEFDKIFKTIGLMWRDVGWTEFKALLAIVALSLTYGGLYFIFSVLIFIGFFGFFVMMGVFPIVLVMAIFTRQILLAWFKTAFNYFLIPLFTAIIMSITLLFLDLAINSLDSTLFRQETNQEIFTTALGMALFVGVLSIGLHWKAPEFAAGLSGGIASGAGSVVGAGAAIAGGSWVIARGIAGGGANAVSGYRGGNLGNKNSMAYNIMNDHRAKMQKGGEDF